MEVKIRLLKESDYLAYKAIRLEMLEKHPTSFSASYRDTVKENDDFFRNCVTAEDNHIFGAFADGILVGVVALKIPHLDKVKHKGLIWSVYVKPEHHNKSIASGLISKLIDFARTKLLYLELACKTNNFHAYKLYKKFGFEVTAVNKYAIKWESKFYDEYIMRLYLN